MQPLPFSHSHKKHICLVGGGHAHLTAIKQLATLSIPDICITLISTDRFTSYSGMLPGLLAGHYLFEDCHIDLRNLCQNNGVQFTQKQVKQIKPNSNLIECIQSSPIRYDYLSINIGSRPAISTIRGAKQYGQPIKPAKRFLCKWHHWLASRPHSNHTQQIVIVGCGAAGIETLLSLHHCWQNTSSRKAKFTLVCAEKTILPTHNFSIQQFFQQYLQSHEITIEYGRVKAIDERQLHLQNGLTIDYDFTVWSTHADAYQWPGISGLQCDQHGFIEIDRYLRSLSHSNIFASGDCARFMPQKLPKSGVFAVRQGPTLLKNLVAACRNQSLVPFQPKKHSLSLLTMGKKYAAASRGAIFVHGSWVWYWKNHIDQQFINSLK